jgi:hypothetical protein
MELPALGRVPFDPALSESCDRGIPYVLEHADTLTGAALSSIAGALTEPEAGGSP